MIWAIVALNIFGWPVIHIVIARVFLSLPDEYFAGESWLTRERFFERRGQLYRETFAAQRWKSLLPDGAPWLGGPSKKRIEWRSRASLTDFLMETRRAEAAHWCMLLCTPVFYIWNPLWACIVMTLYGVAANIPCIVAQRINRIKVARLLAHLRNRL